MERTSVYKQFTAMIEQHCGGRIHKGFTVALSGGVDSVVLLYLCHRYATQNGDLPVKAVYVNHGLSENALQWQHFCEQLCQKLSIMFNAAQVTIQAKPRTSLEAQAREARYLALDKHALCGSTLLIGQHADDQVETFFIRLKRGSGLQGLGAMRVSTTLPSGRHCLRPLIQVERQEIEAFAQTFGLQHIEDESNRSDVFDRNFLRNQVLPLLKGRFKGFVPSLMRSISILQAQQALIDELSESDLALCLHDKCLVVMELGKLSALRQSNVVRTWLAKHNESMPSKKQLEQILRQSLGARVDAQVTIQLTQGSVKLYQGRLYWVDNNLPPMLDVKELSLNDPVSICCDTKLIVCEGKGIRRPQPTETVSLRFACLSDKVKPLGKPGRNTVKHWLKDLNVPTWERTRVPLIYYDDTLVAAVGYFVNEDYASEQGIFWKEVNARK
ncbi:tRNA lysidine(34) synthetase TilS [Pseudoalteromonas luteoviolacea]|uniref:tRNA lysidine(34) synthetase TilS n=1 Tax=Pseudoalteromonas luteoviolacea TaxID=43657 RepID=UPI001B388E7E|nr:tRNA lysidine(34) synthetase TilS [Pseudoalteromonas luteoviolacea]MBQ4810374.1 tRNA lysidine(34) synthetase TilS [Pseudoalteromonas luteoviolacea]